MTMPCLTEALMTNLIVIATHPNVVEKSLVATGSYPSYGTDIRAITPLILREGSNR